MGSTAFSAAARARLVTMVESPGREDESGPIAEAVQLARRLQQRALALQTPQERRQQAELDRMIQHPADKATLVQMTDQAFRSSRAKRSADQLTHILDVQGVPRFFSPLDRTLLRGFQSFGGYLPGVAVPLVKEKMHQETANVVLPAEPDLLAAHLRARRDEGVRMNVNFLGEALLGEAEADRRLEGYLAALQNPDIEVVSVKISTIFSQISPVAREQTIRTLCDRMELLVRAAAKQRFARGDGHEVAKLVYLDMEEYRDLAITVETFLQTLDRRGLEACQAGIVLQAYIPDSFAAQRRIVEWAMRRVAAGGAPVTLRLVKGANMEMERVEASQKGWPAAPFQTKRETDANYKRMLRFALEPDHARAVRVGVASHNLFELAYGLVLAKARGVEELVHLEMLEGMANHQRRALFEERSDLLLYAPACPREDFIHAIGYLIRRLDENTGPDNFLRHAFRLSVDSEQWQQLERDFVEAFEAIPSLGEGPRRTQNRGAAPPAPSPAAGESWPAFRNEPDTDFALPHHADWARSIVEAWRDRHGPQALDVPLVMAGREIFGERRERESTDPSRPGTVVARYRVATTDDVDEAVACARSDPDRWRSLAAGERGDVLRRVAQRIRERRADLMGIALAEGGKVLLESDPEVSEAVDFCEFYARSAEAFAELPDVEAQGTGVVAVVPPWNFPIAIPCGGVAAALAAGNTVILKPAPETVATAWLLCQCFWSAGVSPRALQFVYGENEDAATRLATHEDVDAVIFTGGTATAFHLLRLDPAIPLLAETGGKNATIVTAMSDRDLAIKHVVQSAFGHAGQKCSATSLLILEREVYEDEGFRRTLCDAAESLPVGSAWDLTTVVGPLIRPPRGPLERALKELEAGESWALRPRRLGDNLRLWSPGIKWGVAPGSVTHRTEFFGPVLGVMCAHDLDEAIDLVHQTGYGLTSGLQSLDDREQAHWARRLRAGNLYVNRGTTGAIVLRQPFGGMARSAVGPGIKAGGPNYVAPLMRFREVVPQRETGPVEDERVEELLAELARRAVLDPHTLSRLRTAAASYERAMAEEFGREHDGFHLVGQDNLRRYLRVSPLRIRVHPEDDAFDLFARAMAARAVRCAVTVSTPPGEPPRNVEILHELTESWAAAIEFVEESDDALAEAIRSGQTERVRYADPARVAEGVRRAAAEVGLYLAADPVLAVGRIELLHYLREQSLCVDYHRYGNLGARAGEVRAAVD
jgi:RHH-type proline utilization regulon transcriptional repressor/proline dehydrogenase/delta 1-pyrroline-5-carboxylate dehydrogenase